MGSRQAYSTKSTDEAESSPSTFTENLPQFAGESNYLVDKPQRRIIRKRVAREIPVSSLNEFQLKTTLEVPITPDQLSEHKDIFDKTFNDRESKIDFKDRHCQFTSNFGSNVPCPISRIVGFESSNLDLSCKRSECVHSSGFVGRTDYGPELQGKLVRKRLLSPLNGMLCPKQLNGKSLDIVKDNYHIDSSTNNHKKTKIGNSSYFETQSWPLCNGTKWESDSSSSRSGNSISFTDGMLFENKVHQLCSHSLSEGTMKDRLQAGAIAISSKKLISPLMPLSPLGSGFSQGMTTAGVQRGVEKVLEVRNMNSKKIENLVGGVVSGISITHNEDEFGISIKSFRDVDMLYKDFDFTPENSCVAGRHCGPATPVPQSFKSTKIISVAPARRSLVGSFEESLLSGRLSSGGVSRKIDGFLALLNVTGGSFSPPMQKLPFAVTSVDGDSSLLYYASIDLAGSFPSSKGKGSNMKKSISNENSRAARSRLRIPMKGRIQLVLSNPETTPLHTFFCNYDLSDMPAGTKWTFLRQKVTLSSSEPTSSARRVGSKCRDMRNEFKATPVSGKSHPGKFSYESANRSTSDIPNGCASLKSDGKTLYNDLPPQYPLESNNEVHTASIARVLRYALHLRFLCPSPKKCSRSGRRNSDRLSGSQVDSLDNGERRFYLYNDLRVVFPQRHSDDDEGELNVEYDFPANPRYFEMGH